MLQYQHYSRGREGKDYNLLVDNNSYIIRWSVIQILVVLATSGFQVYFVRKLFENKSTSSGVKSRI